MIVHLVDGAGVAVLKKTDTSDRPVLLYSSPLMWRIVLASVKKEEGTARGRALGPEPIRNPTFSDFFVDNVPLLPDKGR